MRELPRRRMGNTGMRPRALGMGAAFVSHVAEAETIATIERALDLGIDYFDSYAGRNEERWGRALAGVERSSYYMQAKVGPHHERPKDFLGPRPRAGASSRAFRRSGSTISMPSSSTTRPTSPTRWAPAAPSTSCSG